MDQILRYYGLSEEPFTIAPNPAYLYQTQQHSVALYQCQYIIENKRGLAIIYGDVGTGKTTIARRIASKYLDNPDYEVAVMITPDLKTETAFLRGIMSEYGVPPKRSFADSMKAFRRFAGKSYKEGKNLVLLIDEAQQMTPEMVEVIRVFLNFETNTEKFIQVILFGQNELATMIDNMRAIKSRVNVFGSLSSLTDGDIAEMVKFRWQAAGGKEPNPFHQFETIQEICKYSSGLPRSIIKLCNQSLMRAYASETKAVHSSMVVAAAKELRMTEGE